MVSTLFLVYFVLSKGGEHNKKVLITKMEVLIFFYNQHFFYTFTRTGLFGTQVYATEMIPENHINKRHMLELTSRALQKLYDFFVLPFELATKISK